MSCIFKPFFVKYARAASHEIEGEGRSTHAASDFIPSLLPKKTGYDGPPD